VVLFANEENGMYGAEAYAKYAKNHRTEKHVAAIESDAGGHSPRGLMMDATEKLQKSAFNKAQKWRELLTPYGLYEVQAGGSAADIGKLRDLGTVLFGTRPDSQRYFDYHHAATDVFENVHKRELEMGAASMAAWVFLMDKYGF
jgi:Zn-dependent M28 family amino/carboxypeptidase